MDDLYGDLPPAATGSSAVDQSNKFLLKDSLKSSTQLLEVKKASGISKSEQKNVLQSNQIPREEDQKSNEPDQTKPTKIAVSKTKFIPSSLMFKPRQTSSSTAPNISNSARNESASFVREKDCNPLNTLASPAPTLKEDQGLKIEVVFEEVRFNNNDSFDVTDPYDPRRPNDYSQYCAECDEQKRIRVIAEDNKRKMEEMERQRVELENQKRELAEKQDYKKLLELSASSRAVNSNSLSSEGVGRGRGRGVVNLPAWMTQQIKDNEPVAEPDLSQTNQFDDTVLMDTSESAQSLQRKRKFSAISKPSKVLLLKNFVDQKDVDEALKNELISECAKYGSVLRCEIYLLDSRAFPSCASSEVVRVFVEFETQEAAVKGLR